MPRCRGVCNDTWLADGGEEVGDISHTLVSSMMMRWTPVPLEKCCVLKKINNSNINKGTVSLSVCLLVTSFPIKSLLM